MKRTHGFTIVELLIVIIIIGILASIAIVSYTGITTRANNAAILSELGQASRSLRASYVIHSEQYPADLIAAGFTSDSSSGVMLSYFVSPTAQQFCLQGQKANRSYFTTETEPAQSGYCNEHTGVASDGDDETTVGSDSSAHTVMGDGGGLTASMNDDWSAVTLKWGSVRGADKYQAQVNRGDGVWVYVDTATGGAQAVGSWSCAQLESGTYSVHCTSNIPSGSTTLSWTDQNACTRSVDRTYQYRVRAVDGGTNGSWFTASIAPVTTKLTKISGLSVKPSAVGSMSKYTLSWGDASKNNIPNPKIQIQVKRGSEPWVNVNKDNGSTQARGLWTCASIADDYDTYGAYCSAQIDTSVTSVEWNHAHSAPVPGSTYSYRARYRSESIANYASDWVTVNLAR